MLSSSRLIPPTALSAVHLTPSRRRVSTTSPASSSDVASTAAASTSGAPRYPYPTHTRPTPHQIFHLAPGSPQSLIKARYYDLVREHHPDSYLCAHLSATERHARFQSISLAYDVLRGRRASVADPEIDEVLRRRRTSRKPPKQSWAEEFADFGGTGHRHGQGKEWMSSEEDRTKDMLLLVMGGTALLVGLSQLVFVNPVSISDQRHRMAAANLAQARAEGQLYGAERRREIRRRVEAERTRQAGDAKSDSE